MVNTSETWKKKFNQTLVPESFVEITCGITEPGVNAKATVASSTAVEFATTDGLTENDFTSFTKYGTGEPNLCVLDDSCEILPDAAPYENAGFAGGVVVTDDSPDIIRFEIPSKIETPVPGVTVTWSSVFDEYATDFSVAAYLDTTELNTVSVTGNNSIRSDVEMELVGSNAIELKITKWCIPDHRARVEQFKIGRYLVFDKTKLTSYSHTSSRDPIAGQLPQDSISFSLDNSDRLWDSVNPQGIYKYIYERQPVTVRYGMDVDGKTEWVNGGIYFLSEWSVPSNSIEASFTARDAFLYLMTTNYTGRKYGTLYEMCYDALELLEADNITFEIPDVLKDYSTDITSDGASYTNANILQLAANAAGMALYQTRGGVIKIGYAYNFASAEDAQDISVMNNYSWPEINFAQKMLNVATTVGNKSYAYPETPSGRGVIQTISNAMLTDAILAKSRNALTESYSILSNRRKATLSYRASPTTDALDFVKVHHQFDYDAILLLTNVNYTFNGCFKGSLEGYMIADVNSVTLDYFDVTLDWAQSIILTANVGPASVDSPSISWTAFPEGIVSLHVLTNANGKSTCQVSWNWQGSATVTASAHGISASCSFTTNEYRLSNIVEGDTVFVEENGTLVEFIVAKRNYESKLNGTGRTLLVRKIAAQARAYDSDWAQYDSSDIDNWLNNSYASAFSLAARALAGTTSFYCYRGQNGVYRGWVVWANIYYASTYSSATVITLSKKFFLLSALELGCVLTGTSYNPYVSYDLNNDDNFGSQDNLHQRNFNYSDGSPLPLAKQIALTMLQANSAPKSVIWTRSPNFNDGYVTKKDPSYHTGLGTSVEGIIGYQDSSTKKWNYQTTVASVSTSRYVHPAFTVPDTVFIGPNKEIRFEESANEV